MTEHDRNEAPAPDEIRLSTAGGVEDNPLNDIDSLQSEVERLQGELETLRDQTLRAHAETENSRKRMRREMEESQRYAAQPLLTDLLPVLDNVGRAIEASEKTSGSDDSTTAGLLAGFRMVAQQLEAVLARHGCTRIEALHQPFDPGHHAAILQQPSADHPPGTVIQVAQDGYQLHDRVIRPAQVIVASAPS